MWIAFGGVPRPGTWGGARPHIIRQKPFWPPPGGGGRGGAPGGAGPPLEPYLPVPTVEKEGRACILKHDPPKSIGRGRSFFGNFGMFVRAYAYILALGPDALRRMSESAVLNANYVPRKLEDVYHLPCR